MTDNKRDSLEEFVVGYCNVVKAGFRERWDKYRPEIYNNEISEAIGGLAARQATLANEIARNPGIWNGHIAPVILRCMTDTHITLAWILTDPKDRSREYIRFGLGQEKLYLEYLQNEADQIPEGEIDGRLEELIELRKSWLNSQLMEWAIEVNVGSWSGKTTREMATEAGCESLYKFAYVPFSGPAHSMWQHVGIYNVVPCKNPLHKNHRIPVIPEMRLDPDYLYRSAKYVSRTYELLSEKLDLDCDVPLPVDYFVDNHPFKSTDENGDS
jgi:hypothetical protein